MRGSRREAGAPRDSGAGVAPGPGSAGGSGRLAAMEEWSRVRLVFGKRGPLRFLGQLDIGRALDRALRRSGLPVRWSEGFNPRIRLSFPCASPTGMASRCEIVELQVAAPAGPREVVAGLREALGPDLPVHSAEPVPAGERLRLVAAAYGVRSREGGPPLPGEAALEALLARESVPVVRRGKPLDLRPLVAELRPRAGGLLVRLRFLASGRTARPEDVLEALGADPAAYSLERTGMTLHLRRGAEEEEREYGGDDGA